LSEFHATVIRLKEIRKHPNADTLSITSAFAYPVIFQTTCYQVGDLAAYVPVDAVVPPDEARWGFLRGSKGDFDEKHRRIRAKKIRGIFSMGILTPADPSWVEGQDVTEALALTKYEPPVPISMGGQNERDPGFIPTYTDVEGLRRWPEILREGEPVVLTEKIHGTNARFCWHEGRLWCGSHHNIKAPDSGTVWWQVAKQYNLETKLQQFPGVVFYGEVYGAVQDLRYGAKPGELFLALFDAFVINGGYFVAPAVLDTMARMLELPTAPVLYVGPWHPEQLAQLANGASNLAEHIREGFVVRPVKERWNEAAGRVILKLIGEDYLLRKGG
jgi:RNA ligase (TIGR02306 family)